MDMKPPLSLRLSGELVCQFVTMVAAEKFAVLDTQDYFRSQVERAELQAFDRIMARAGGQPHARATSASLGGTVFAVAG